MQDEEMMIVMTINVGGFTEEDIWFARSLLQDLLITYRLEKDSLLYEINTGSYEGMPILNLMIDSTYWKKFAQHNDMAEYSYMLSQPAIWGETH